MNSFRSVILAPCGGLCADRRAAAGAAGLCPLAVVGESGRGGADKLFLHGQLFRRARVARLVVARSVAATIKLLQARIVEPHSLEGEPGAIHLWVEALDDDNRPSGVPRAYRLPYNAKLAEKTEKAIAASADGRPQGGRTADFGDGEGEWPKRRFAW